VEEIAGLASETDRRWASHHRREEAFADIATELLIESDLARRLSPQAVLLWAARARLLPRQELGSTFGQPPITLHAGEDFEIQALFWFDGTTSIHQHAFSGAFQVLAGSSVHTRYRFTERRAINTHFGLGRIDYLGSELLRTGDTRSIIPGDTLIHGLFHLDRPSVTLVLRTYLDPRHLPQYRYFRPALRENGFYRPMSLARRLEALETLRKIDPDAHAPAILEAVQSADLFEAMRILMHTLETVPEDGDTLLRLAQAARDTHGDDVEEIAVSLAEKAREERIVGRRRTVVDPEHRFLLALLLNVPDRQSMIRMVEDRYPGESAIDRIAGWLAKLEGAPGAADEEIRRWILKDLLQGRTRDESMRRWRAERGAPGQTEPFEEMFQRFEASELCRPLMPTAA
jgi:hypothetical protein